MARIKVEQTTPVRIVGLLMMAVFAVSSVWCVTYAVSLIRGGPDCAYEAMQRGQECVNAGGQVTDYDAEARDDKVEGWFLVGAGTFGVVVSCWGSVSMIRQWIRSSRQPVPVRPAPPVTPAGTSAYARQVAQAAARTRAGPPPPPPPPPPAPGHP